MGSQNTFLAITQEFTCFTSTATGEAGRNILFLVFRGFDKITFEYATTTADLVITKRQN